MAAVYINGVVLSVGQPTELKNSDGSTYKDKNGMSVYSQSVLFQHEFKRSDGTGFNKYVMFEVIGNAVNKRISKLGLTPNEECEVGLDLDVQFAKDGSGRCFNRTPSCFAVERDKQKWHRPVQQRVATMPTASGQNAAPAYTPAAPAQPVAAAPAQPEAYAPQYNFPPAQENEDLPF